jgi:surfactin synthase thioesterase subunit
MENVERWEEMTTETFEFRHFPGGHCFLHANESEAELVDWILDLLNPLLK